MKHLYTKVKTISFNDYFESLLKFKEVSLKLSLSHTSDTKDDKYICKSSISIDHDDHNILSAEFNSLLLSDSNDSRSDNWVHKESLNLVYPQIRTMITSIMAASMLRPISIPDIAPTTETNDN